MDNKKGINELRKERSRFGVGNIPFPVGEEVTCIFSQGTKNLHTGRNYIVDAETNDSIEVRIITGKRNNYLSTYKKWRFTFPDFEQKMREIKIDSIL